MKKLLFFVMAVMALTSCYDDKNEPLPLDEKTTTTLYMAVNGYAGIPEAIYNLDGEKIFECQEGGHIQSLVSYHSDWYALICWGNGVYQVVKNGNVIHEGDGKIHCFTVYCGDVYTVLENNNKTIWACKNFQRMFDVTDDMMYYTFTVCQGFVCLPFCGDIGGMGVKSGFTMNDSHFSFEDGDMQFNWVYGIDIGDQFSEMLITYEDGLTRKYMYWWNGTKHECPDGFVPISSRLVNGHAFILGYKIASPGSSMVLPTVLIDGVETVLNNDGAGWRAVSMAAHDADTYILVNLETGTHSYVYKNLQPIQLPDVTTPYQLVPYGSDQHDGKTNLSILGIKAIAVVEVIEKTSTL